MQTSVQIGLNWNWPTGTELGKNDDGKDFEPSEEELESNHYITSN